MRRLVATLALALAFGVVVSPVIEPGAAAQTWTGMWQVRVTNLTTGQYFTPVLAATHSADAMVFAPGMQASAELQALAEGGDVMPLRMALEGMSSVMAVETGMGLMPPGGMYEFLITGGSMHRYLSLAAMLIPTNDAFVGISMMELPVTPGMRMVYAYAYDAGTEMNAETCGTIPGPNYPECGGPGGHGHAGMGEGYISIHNGINGVGDFGQDRDWKNPVAMITIHRIS